MELTGAESDEGAHTLPMGSPFCIVVTRSISEWNGEFGSPRAAACSLTFSANGNLPTAGPNNSRRMTMRTRPYLFAVFVLKPGRALRARDLAVWSWGLEAPRYYNLKRLPPRGPRCRALRL